MTRKIEQVTKNETINKEKKNSKKISFVKLTVIGLMAALLSCGISAQANAQGSYFYETGPFWGLSTEIDWVYLDTTRTPPRALVYSHVDGLPWHYSWVSLTQKPASGSFYDMYYQGYAKTYIPRYGYEYECLSLYIVKDTLPGDFAGAATYGHSWGDIVGCSDDFAALYLK